jgi:hypothetical protein
MDRKGDKTALYSDEQIKKQILDLYIGNEYTGYSFDEFRELLALPQELDDVFLKGIVGKLLAEKELEYVDYRCYRRYPSFLTYLENHPDLIDDRAKEMILNKLEGKTLEEIGSKHCITRERVRQIISKSFRNKRSPAVTGISQSTVSRLCSFYNSSSYEQLFFLSIQ